MFTPRFDAVDSTDPKATANFLELALSLPAVKHWKHFSHDRLLVDEGDKVLDIGCGTGADAIALSHRVGTTGRVVGVDLSHALISLATSNSASLGLPVTFQQADIHALPFPDAFFDKVRIDRVLHFLPDITKALQQTARVTAPGGRIVVTEPEWRSLIIHGGDARVTDAIHELASGKTTDKHFSEILVQCLDEAGWTFIDQHASVLEVHSYSVAVTLFGLESLAATAVASKKITVDEGTTWLRSLLQSAKKGDFFASLSGVIVTSERRRR